MSKAPLILSLISMIMVIIEGFQPVTHSINPIWIIAIVACALISIVLGIININKGIYKKISIASIIISVVSIIVFVLTLHYGAI